MFLVVVVVFFLGENDATSMFLVVVVLFFWRKGCSIDVSGCRCFVFFGENDAPSMFLVVQNFRDGSPWGGAAILCAKIMDVMDANATVQNRPKSLEPSKYSGR